MKIVVFDYETTGLDPYEGAEPIEIAAIMLNEKLEEISRFPARNMRVSDPTKINPKALEVNGKTVEQIMAGEHPGLVHTQLIAWIKKNKSDYKEKVYLAGHNVKFDIKFLEATSKAYHLEDIYKTVNYHSLDTCNFALADKIKKQKYEDRISLVALSEELGIKHSDAHTAMSDCEATADLLRHYLKC